MRGTMVDVPPEMIQRQPTFDPQTADLARELNKRQLKDINLEVIKVSDPISEMRELFMKGQWVKVKEISKNALTSSEKSDDEQCLYLLCQQYAFFRLEDWDNAKAKAEELQKKWNLRSSHEEIEK